MKIRLGFVTNSSSSSFVAWGVYVNKIKISDMVVVREFNRLVEKNRRYVSLTDEQLAVMTVEDMYNYLKDEGHIEGILGNELFTVGGSQYDFIGITPCSMIARFPDGKIGEIKQIVAAQFNKRYGTNFTERDISYYEEGWYDG